MDQESAQATGRFRRAHILLSPTNSITLKNSQMPFSHLFLKQASNQFKPLDEIKSSTDEEKCAASMIQNWQTQAFQSPLRRVADVANLRQGFCQANHVVTDMNDVVDLMTKRFEGKIKFTYDPLRDMLVWSFTHV